MPNRSSSTVAAVPRKGIIHCGATTIAGRD
jgi:hypothetical protein